MLEDLGTDRIRNWRSIVTLIAFLYANFTILFPFHIHVFTPRVIWESFRYALSKMRIVPTRESQHQPAGPESDTRRANSFLRLRFPINQTTGPLISVLFLLAISAIGREEVEGGTIGRHFIFPLDVILFFWFLTYLALSIYASGLPRYVIFKVLQRGGPVGHRLFLYIYILFFGLATFVGSNPVIITSTRPILYMTKISSNILHPRAWVFTQFAIANIASAVLVPSNPANLVLAGAFGIPFFHFTANTIIPVIATAIFLFPFLLYVVFANEDLIPFSIKIYEFPGERAGGEAKKSINPIIPPVPKEDPELDNENSRNLSVKEIMNPFLDKGSAIVGTVILLVTLVVLLALNSTGTFNKRYLVLWTTGPAALVMFLWDISIGWVNRHATREIARRGREAIEERAKQLERESKENAGRVSHEPGEVNAPIRDEEAQDALPNEQPTLVSFIRYAIRWCQETFPTATAALALLPYSFVPFTLSMFVLIHALVTKGWILVFAHGWDNWVTKTGTMGAICGMSFLSAALSNISGTNIGASILLCRLIQTWEHIRENNGVPISDRTFWGTIYSLAIGVNYGAFSTFISASLTGLMWRDILTSNNSRVHGIDFIKVNVPIISIAMVIGCSVLVGEVYIMRDDSSYR